MPRLILVRHAPAVGTGKVLTGRLPGHPLSPEGKELAADTAEALAGSGITSVYTSPLQRCRQTAAIIAATTGTTPVVDARLAEVDYGSWSGRSLASLRRLAAWRRLLAVPSRFRFPEGESLTEARARTVEFLEELAAGPARSKAVVVTHADVIRLAVGHYLGQPLDMMHRLWVAPASISIIDLPAPDVVAVPVVNYVPGWRP